MIGRWRAVAKGNGDVEVDVAKRISRSAREALIAAVARYRRFGGPAAGEGKA